MTKQSSEEKYLTYINNRFPDIVLKEGEDLNIESMKQEVFKKLWMNLEPIKTISKETGYSLRSIFRLARMYNLPLKRELKVIKNNN